VNVFVDASALVAHVNRRDNHHDEALAIFAALRQRRAALVSTNWIAYEALSIIKTRVGPTAASGMWRWLSTPGNVQLISVVPNIEQRALDLFFAYDDKTWGVVDCASLVVMEQLSCREAFAFDHHFVEASRQRGFEVLRAE